VRSKVEVQNLLLGNKLIYGDKSFAYELDRHYVLFYLLVLKRTTPSTW